MISHITITVDDGGRLLINQGDVITSVAHSPTEALIFVRQQLTNLGYFPHGPIAQITTPTPYAELPIPKARSTQHRKSARHRAEARLAEARADDELRYDDEPPPPGQPTRHPAQSATTG